MYGRCVACVSIRSTRITYCVPVHMRVQKTSHWARCFVDIVVVVDGSYVGPYYANISRSVVTPNVPTSYNTYVCMCKCNACVECCVRELNSTCLSKSIHQCI